MNAEQADSKPSKNSRQVRRMNEGQDITRYYALTMLKNALSVVGTLGVACLGAQICLALQTPLPWMIGPLLATALASIVGAPTLSATPLRNAAQCTVGLALGLYFTPEVMRLVGSLWWAILLGVVWALALGWLFGCFLHHLHDPSQPRLDRATTFFAGAIGAASEMTLLAERAQGRADLVASAHSLRLLMVTVLIPFAMQFSGLHGLDRSGFITPDVRWWGLAGLYALAAVCSYLLDRYDRANPWFMGSLLVAMVLTAWDVRLSTLPASWVNAAQLVIGVSLGVRFTRQFVMAAPRWLALVALGTLGLMALCAGFGIVMSWMTGLHPATMMLATAPGGIAEMSITAKVLQLGAPMVTALQVSRLMAVLVLLEPIYRRFIAAPKN